MAERDFGILLQTKVRMPVLRAALSDRDRLYRLDNYEQWPPLTVVNAPAGYGKTTYLQQAAEKLKECGYRVAWISYDREDDRLDAALAYLVAAISYACPEIEQRLTQQFEVYRDGRETSLLAVVINALADLDQSLVLMVDDLHCLSSQKIHQTFQYFVRNLPAKVRCILSSRTSLPWNWADLPLADQLWLIDSEQLRFTDEETVAYLEQVHGSQIDPRDVRKISERTEGWIAAIQLLAPSIKDLKEDGSFDQVGAGKSKILFDQLAEVTLNGLSEEDLAFLLQVAPLGRFTAELAQHVTGLANTKEILRKIDALNLFLIVLDGGGRWFRFHALFKEFLARKLAQHSVYDEKAIHASASEWFASIDHPIEATHHALLAGDLRLVSRLLDTAIPRLVRYSQRSLLVSWLEHVAPTTKLEISVNAMLALLWSHISAREFDKARALIDRAQEILACPEPPAYAQITPRDRPCLELAKVALQRHEDPSCDNSERIREINKTLASNWYLERGIAENELGHNYWYNNELEKAYIAFLEARSQTEFDSHLSLLVDSISSMADIRLEQGRLHESLRLAEEVVDRLGALPQYVGSETGIEIPAVGFARLIQAEIHFESGAIAEARQLLETAEPLVELRGVPEFMLRARILRAEIETIESDKKERAERFLEIGSSPMHGTAGNAANELCARQVWTQIDLGQLSTAEAILERYGMPVHSHGPSPQFKIIPAKERLYLSLAYFHIAAGNTTIALNWLRHVANWSRQSGRQICYARVQGMLAVCLNEQGRQDEAMRAIREMMVIGEQHELFMSIANLSPKLEGLLQKYCALRIRQFDNGELSEPPLYARRFAGESIANRIATFSPAVREENETSAYDDELIEPLTSRETEVLILVAKGLKNQEIADELLIAITSVKWHVKNIFAKLAVRRRTEAVAKARSLKLLPK